MPVAPVSLFTIGFLSEVEKGERGTNSWLDAQNYANKRIQSQLVVINCGWSAMSILAFRWGSITVEFGKSSSGVLELVGETP